MPQPLQGHAHGRGKNFPGTLPTELPHCNSGVGPTENAKNKKPSCPDKVTCCCLRLANTCKVLDRGPKTCAALKPAIRPLEQLGMPRPFVLGLRHPFIFSCFGSLCLSSKALRVQVADDFHLIQKKHVFYLLIQCLVTAAL